MIEARGIPIVPVRVSSRIASMAVSISAAEPLRISSFPS